MSEEDNKLGGIGRERKGDSTRRIKREKDINIPKKRGRPKGKRNYTPLADINLSKVSKGSLGTVEHYVEPDIEDGKVIKAPFSIATNPTWDGIRYGKEVRKTGIKKVFSRDATERFKELEFDPLAATVDLYYEICDRIEQMDNPSGKRRYAPQALSSMITTKEKLLSNLMKFGYRPVPENVEHDVADKLVMKVIFTKKEELSKPDEIKEVDGLVIDEPHTPLTERLIKETEEGETKHAEDNKQGELF